jgi:hypothetical protein
MNKKRMLLGAASVVFAGVFMAQTPITPPTQNSGAGARGANAAQSRSNGARGRNNGGGNNGINPGFDSGGAGIGSAEVATLIFEEHWRDIPMAEPITHEHLTNQDLLLHIYGDWQHIRATQHPTEAYTYTGETVTNWALTLSDPKFYYDLSGTGKVMLRTRNSGYRFTHVVIKTLDGKWYASEEGSPESTSWIEREYALSDLHWRILLMTDTPSNSSNRRQPDPKLVPIVPMGVGHPDLAKVDEVGFSDLMPGGWIPSTSRVNSWKVFGKKVQR